jgi:ABC-type transporter Mla subunit MlaD
MSPRVLYLRVGGMVAASVVLLVLAIVALSGDRLANGRAYETYFRESVEGLDVGAPVKFRGVTLGRVTDIGLVSAEYGANPTSQIMDPNWRMVVVRFKIDQRRVGNLPPVALAVRNGLRAKLANQGLTGVMFLELDFLPADQHAEETLPWEPEDDYIPSVPSTIAQVRDMVTSVLRHLDAVDFAGLSAHADGLLTELRAALGPHGDVHETLAAAQSAIGGAQEAIKGADLPALSAQVRQAGAAIEALARGPRTQAVLRDAQAALARLPGLIAQVQQTAGRAGGGIADAQAELIPILEDLRATMQNLRETTEAIRRDPGAVLLQAPPPGQPRR